MFYYKLMADIWIMSKWRQEQKRTNRALVFEFIYRKYLLIDCCEELTLLTYLYGYTVQVDTVDIQYNKNTLDYFLSIQIYSYINILNFS